MGKLEHYFQRKAAVLAERRADFTADPGRSRIAITASSTLAGITGVRPTRMGDHVMVTDSAPGLAGHALGPTAPEMLLGALASCLVHTYVIQAVLLDIPLEHVEIHAEARLDMAGVVGLPYEQAPRLEDIVYRVDLDSPADPEALEKMHRLVEETCPVLSTLRYPVDVVRRTNTPQPM